MAIKRVLLPVSEDTSFEPLADAAFHHRRDVLRSGHGPVCSGAGLGNPGR